MARRVLSPASLLDVGAVRALAAAEGLKEQHLKAVWRAVVREGATDLDAAAEKAGLPARGRAALVARFACPTSAVVDAIPTTAQKGFKLVVELQDGQRVETVAIVHEVADAQQREAGGAQGRITVCVSSQVGCRMGCTCTRRASQHLELATSGPYCRAHSPAHSPEVD